MRALRVLPLVESPEHRRLYRRTPPGYLNRTWQIAEGGLDSAPAMFKRQVPVPGLVTMATPAFVEPGQRMPDRR
jgi:hypothetical protein